MLSIPQSAGAPRPQRGTLGDHITDVFAPPKTAAEKRTHAAHQRAFEAELLAAAAMSEGARFYNRSDAIAQYGYWVRNFWDADQATALSFGKEPEVVNYQSLARFESVWPFSREFLGRRKLIRQLFRRNGWDVAAPNWLVAKSRLLGFEFPEELERELRSADRIEHDFRPNEATPDEVASLRQQLADLTCERDEALEQARQARDDLKRELMINPKALRSLQALVYALARKCNFSVDKRNAAVANIKKVIDGTPAETDASTIYDWLHCSVVRFETDERA